MKKKIFVTRRLLRENEEKLKTLFEVTLNKDDKIYTPQEIIDGSKNYDGILSSVTDPINADTISKLSSSIKIIANGAVGFGNIDLKSLFEQSEFLSINCPATPETKNLVNRETLKYLKENTVIGNAARGDIVDDDAMVEALKNGTVFAYGLDVYNGEPKIHPEYLKLKNIFLLPHLGSATKRTRWDMVYRATKNLEDFFSGKKPQDQVN